MVCYLPNMWMLNQHVDSDGEWYGWMHTCFPFASKMVAWIIEGGQTLRSCYEVIFYDNLFRSLPELLVYSNVQENMN